MARLLAFLPARVDVVCRHELGAWAVEPSLVTSRMVWDWFEKIQAPTQDAATRRSCVSIETMSGGHRVAPELIGKMSNRAANDQTQNPGHET